uniref:CMP/dCMP-type deaminase domain-containing protein n=2 Tax=Ditylenchus dipsaci TaxID=166011 RepID=A0A915EFI8_9BILA
MDWPQQMVREALSEMYPANDSFMNGSMDSLMTLSDQLIRNDTYRFRTQMSKLSPISNLSVTDEQLIEHAVEAMKNSYSPYSNFPVGAALLTTDGTVFRGTNVETLLLVALFVLKEVPCQLDVICSPCGICRQCMVEFGDFRVIQYSPSTKLRVDTTVRELLPIAFTPHEFSLLSAKNNETT